MAALAYRSSGYDPHASPVRRGASFALALAIAALILWAFVHMGGHIPLPFGNGRPLAVFNVDRSGDTPRQATVHTEQKKQQQAQKATTATAQAPKTAPPVPVPAKIPSDALPGVIYMGSADFRRTDIGKIKGTAATPGVESASAGKSDPAIGLGPNGEPMYNAEWYRRPRRAETEPYMPVGKVGWGMIACRTAPRYRVEDCVYLGETPGSRIGHGLLNAAWQFLVRPPKKGGVDQIGAWVQIRFDLVAPGEKVDDDAAVDGR